MWQTLQAWSFTDRSIPIQKKKITFFRAFNFLCPKLSHRVQSTLCLPYVKTCERHKASFFLSLSVSSTFWAIFYGSVFTRHEKKEKLQIILFLILVWLSISSSIFFMIVSSTFFHPQTWLPSSTPPKWVIFSFSVLLFFTVLLMGFWHFYFNYYKDSLVNVYFGWIRRLLCWDSLVWNDETTFTIVFPSLPNLVYLG